MTAINLLWHTWASWGQSSVWKSHGSFQVAQLNADLGGRAQGMVATTAPEWDFQGPEWGVSDSRACLTTRMCLQQDRGPQQRILSLLQAALQVWTCPRHQHYFQTTLKQSFLNSWSVSALREDRSSQNLCHHSLWSVLSLPVAGLPPINWQ